MNTQSLPQADGDSTPHVHATSYERELDALTRQLIRTVSVRVLGRVQHAVPIPTSHESFRVLAGLAVAMADSGRRQTLKLQLAEEMAEDRDRVHDVRGFARQVIEEYESRLMNAGEKAVTR